MPGLADGVFQAIVSDRFVEPVASPCNMLNIKLKGAGMAVKASLAASPVAAVVGLLVATYVAFPCLTLYRLDCAVARRDAAALRRLVDWPRVRHGIEADLAGPRDELAPFGASFLRKIAVNSAVTPESVLTALNAKPERTEGSGLSGRLRGAWLDGPAQLVLDFGTIRLRMELRRGSWEVTRAWLSPDILARARAEAGEAQLSSSVSQ
jgi:hypothetical protein